MMISEDRQSHLAHVLTDSIWEDDLVDYKDEDQALRLAKKAIAEFVKEDTDIDQRARDKVATLKRGVVEGPQTEHVPPRLDPVRQPPLEIDPDERARRRVGVPGRDNLVDPMPRLDPRACPRPVLPTAQRDRTATDHELDAGHHAGREVVARGDAVESKQRHVRRQVLLGAGRRKRPASANRGRRRRRARASA